MSATSTQVALGKVIEGKILRYLVDNPDEVVLYAVRLTRRHIATSTLSELESFERALEEFEGWEEKPNNEKITLTVDV